MPEIIPIILFGWIAVAITLFAMLPPRRAVLSAYILAWMFLPVAQIALPGLPDLTKVTSASLGALLGVLLFDPKSITSLRPRLVDLPIIVWCFVPLVSAIQNGHGPYDGASGVLTEVVRWGIPYLIGRAYFNSLESLRDLAMAIMIGGLIYVPLCLFEIRFSPQLHKIAYGMHPSHFAMTIRYGGYRPMVFMQHGLMVGMWMTSATLIGIWLWSCKSVRSLFNIPMWAWVGVLIVTTVLCKSTGALLLLVGGIGTLYGLRIVKTSWAMVFIVLITPTYMFARTAGWYSGEDMVALAAEVSAERARSLEGRLLNEDMLTEKAMKRPLFGYGAWGDWRVYDEHGNDITVSDGMWVIALGRTGLVGLISLTTMLLLPVLLLVRRLAAKQWHTPAVAPAAALSLLLVLYAMDNLMNAMLNPIFVLIVGGLTGLYIQFPIQQAAAAAKQRAQRAAMAMALIIARRRQQPAAGSTTLRRGA